MGKRRGLPNAYVDCFLFVSWQICVKRVLNNSLLVFRSAGELHTSPARDGSGYIL